MAFPNTQIQTTNLDSDADSPSLARVDLYNAVVALNTIIDGANTSDSVCVLNSAGTIGSTQVPLTVTPTGTLTLAPTTGVVKIQNVLRLQQLTTQQITARTNIAAGDLAYATDGDGGAPCITVYDGTDWRVIRLMTTLGDTSATATITASISCTAEVV